MFNKLMEHWNNQQFVPMFHYYIVIYYTKNEYPSYVAGIGKMEVTYEKVTE